MDSRTTSGFFISYPEKSKGYRFYCPNHSTRNFETGNVRFIENGEISGSMEAPKMEIQGQQINDPTLHNEIVTNELVVAEPHEITFRRSQRQEMEHSNSDFEIN